MHACVYLCIHMNPSWKLVIRRRRLLLPRKSLERAPGFEVGDFSAPRALLGETRDIYEGILPSVGREAWNYLLSKVATAIRPPIPPIRRHTSAAKRVLKSGLELLSLKQGFSSLFVRFETEEEELRVLSTVLEASSLPWKCGRGDPSTR